MAILSRMAGDTRPEHLLTREPAPMVDAWLAKCACGWRKPVSFYEFKTREDVFAEIDRLFEDHLFAERHADRTNR